MRRGDAALDRAEESARRRRRTTIASGLAAAVTVAGIGFAVVHRAGADTSPDPADPTRTTDLSDRIDPGLPEGVRHLLGRGEVHAWDVSAVDGTVTAFWRACGRPGKPYDPCRFAWTMRHGSEVTGDLLDAKSPMITPVPGGWLIDEQRRTLLLTTDGDLEEVRRIDLDGDPLLPGDTAVPTFDGSRLLRDGALIAMPEPDDRSAVGHAYVTPSGRLIAATSSAAFEWSLRATDDGRTWEEPTAGPPGTPSARVAGSGDHVAAMYTGDAPDGSMPVERVLVSSDAGRTWTTVRGLDTKGADRSRNPYWMTVTPSGTTYVTTENDGLVRIDGDGNAQATPLSSMDTSVFTVDDDVCVVAEAGVIDELRCSSDDGTTWAPRPLPGTR
jgi:hypothetical protein